jgi:metallophosphoesterase superfamily enzyme
VTKANPINSHAALLLEYVNKDSELKKFLVISDLHIGSEIELIKKGINIDTSQISKDILIMGHVHPIFINPNSVVHGKRLWIYLKVKKESIFGLQTTTCTSSSSSDIIELIIVPTFNKYFYSLRSLSYREYKSTISISPLIKQLIKNDGILSGLLFTLEGSLIGDIKEIENLFY